jgi:hypothetical protein
MMTPERDIQLMQIAAREFATVYQAVKAVA